MKDCGKCSGSCCEKFTFPFSLSELDRMIQAPMSENYIDADDGKEDLKVVRDPQIRQIRDMLIYLGPTNVNPATGNKFGENDNLDWSEDGKDVKRRVEIFNKDKTMGRFLIDLENQELMRHSYTCKHFDKESRLCTNYENRPAMCRNFGQTNKCEYSGCTLKSMFDEEL